MSHVYAADWVLPMDGGPPVRDGGVAVDEGRITGVGPVAGLDGDVERLPGCVILPGFVNAHTHLEYAVYPGFGDGLPFVDWLSVHISRKRRLDADGMADSARLGAAECLASGVTTVGDASYTGVAGSAMAELGLRGIVYLEVFGGPDELDGRFLESLERAGPGLSERVRLGISPHAPYSTSEDLYRACLDRGLPIATHLAESRAEHDWLLSGGGPWSALRDLLQPPKGTTGIRALASAGLLRPSMTAAHCVTVDAEEIELLARHDVAVVHCPRSNAYLGCGVAPVARLLDAGVRVGLGTDSPASTPSFDMFEEMRAAVTLARAAAGDAGALPAYTALELATAGSARTLGLADEVGTLTPGKHADLTILDLAGSPFQPIEDPAVAVVLGGTPARVSRTIVGGATRYARGGFTWDELRQNGAAARARMLESSRIPPSSS